MMVELDTTMEDGNNNTSILDNKEVSDASWGRLKTLNPLYPHYYIQNEECIFGRNSACQVPFTDKRISSKHCRIYRKKDEGQVDYRFYIDDYSSNGTFVNRKRVGKGNTVPIVNGNEISLSTVVDPEDPARIMYIFEDLEQMRTKEMLERENNESGFTQNIGDDSEIISLADMSPIKKGNSNLSTTSNDSVKVDQLNTTTTAAVDTTTDVTPIKKTTSTTTALPSSSSSSSDNSKVLKRKSSEMDTSVDEGLAKKKLQTSNDQSNDSLNTDDDNNNNNTNTTTNIPTATTTTTTTTTTPTKKQEIDIEETIGENLICGICQDIIHKCLTLIPCMHNFCVCCYGDWRAGSIECPQCRQSVKSAQKNHAINNLIELYLKKNPEKIRDPEELESMDKRCKITDDMLKKGLLNKSARKYEDDYDEDDEYYDEEDEDDEEEEYHYPKCTFCAPNPPNPTTGYQCAAAAQHLNCANCYKMFPKEPVEPPGIRCGFCTKSYCNLYQQCALGGNFGKMKDLPINMIPSDTLGGNQFEIKIVSDYLQKNNKSVRQLYLDLLNDIETKKLVIPANANIILPADPITEQLRCLGCASSFFSKALFYYRLAIPKDQLPDYAQKRDPCYYGRNCRTQFSKFDHAKRLDHICDQTKF